LDIDPWRASMKVAGIRLSRVRDVAEHCAVSVTTIDPVSESGQFAAVTVGRGRGMFWVSGAAALACEQAVCALLGIDYARAVVVA
jgi:hypothetical protein